MRKIRVLVVDDSAFMRKLITDFLSEEKTIEIIGTARDGEDAVKKVELLNPDVVTLDIEMPVMNGLDALREIMGQFPRPVIMLSSTTKEGAENTIKSLQLGAVDFITKPSGAISLDLYKIKNEIIEKVILADSANIRRIRKEVNEKNTPLQKIRNIRIGSFNSGVSTSIDQFNVSKNIICIGTSTGGPRALQHVLTNLPADIHAPIFIVQHMPPGFTQSLANRLNTLSAITVKEAENDEVVKNGIAYIAPGGSHLLVIKTGSSLMIKIENSELRNGHRPSVDVLFDSISKISDYRKIAVIMTGMGSDGTEGLKKLKLNGDVKAISESEQTSVVYGMPKAALSTKLIDKVDNVEDIAASIMNFIRN